MIPPFCLAPMERAARRRKHASITRRHMAREFASARRSIDERVTVGHAVEGQIVPATPTAAALPKPPIAGDLDKAEAARLIARASALIGQGNIGAARITLERAAESGDAEASFMLRPVAAQQVMMGSITAPLGISR